MTVVDLHSKKRYTLAQVGKACRRKIEAKHLPYNLDDIKEIAIGVALGEIMTPAQVALLNAYIAESRDYETDYNDSKIDMALVNGAIDYEQATSRLARYRLADGRPEQLAQDAVYDEFGVLVSEAVPYLEAIPPLPALVNGDPIYDLDGVTILSYEQIPNPEIVRDDAERAAAQSVLDGSSLAVTDLVALRGGA